MDDELNILPISSHMKSVTPVPVKEDSEGLSEVEREMKDMKEELKDAFLVGPLIKKCCTHDHAKAVSRFLEAILDTRLRNTVALLAGRGRGKSAALGLAIARAVAAGYSNIFVTAPSPENLKRLWELLKYNSLYMSCCRLTSYKYTTAFIICLSCLIKVQKWLNLSGSFLLSYCIIKL